MTTKDWTLKIIGAISLLLALLLLRFLVLRLLRRWIKDKHTRLQWEHTLWYLGLFLTIILLADLLLGGISSIITIIGFISAGIAFALRDLIANLAGWFYIIAQAPFAIGHRIQIGEVHGDVLDIQPFATIVMEIDEWIEGDQATGRIVYIPNYFFFTKDLHVYDRHLPLIWDEITIYCKFESNLEKVETELINCTKEVISEFKITELIKIWNKQKNQFNLLEPIHDTKWEPKIFFSFSERGVKVNLYYPINAYYRRNIQSAITRKISEKLQKHSDIYWSYPTQEIKLEKD